MIKHNYSNYNAEVLGWEEVRMQQLHAVFKGSVNYLGRRPSFLDMDSCKRVKVINNNKKLSIPRRTELHI